MAIDLNDSTHRSKLQKAIRTSYERDATQRAERKDLIERYEGRCPDWAPNGNDGRSKYTTVVNTFQQFVRGHILSLSFNNPKWSVKAQLKEARGFDFTIQSFLKRYSEVLKLRKLMKQWAYDSAFGDAVAKVFDGPAPKGVNSPVAPRVLRRSRDHVILDRSASIIEECTYICDFYLVPLNEAQREQSYTLEGRYRLTAWNENDGSQMIPEGQDTDILPEEMTRLVDVFFPKQGIIATWPAKSDRFEEIATEPPLAVRQTRTNPYKFFRITEIPDKVDEIAFLGTLKPLHVAANDFWFKAFKQARDSKRNPVTDEASIDDLRSALFKGDGEAAVVDNLDKLGLYALPGADQSLVSLAGMSLSLFSQYGGNLEVALGQSAGADTARQTQALMTQLGALQTLVRSGFEEFLSEIGQGLATLAFDNEVLELYQSLELPGMNMAVNIGWGNAWDMPRVGEIDDYLFEVVPYSTAYRSPEDRVQQLQTASQIFMGWAAGSAQGFPLNLEAIQRDLAEAFQLVPNLAEWWSGEPPAPAQQASNTYASMVPQGPSDRTLNYDGAGGGGQDPLAAFGGDQPGGLQRLAGPGAGA